MGEIWTIWLAMAGLWAIHIAGSFLVARRLMAQREAVYAASLKNFETAKAGFATYEANATLIIKELNARCDRLADDRKQANQVAAMLSGRVEGLQKINTDLATRLREYERVGTIIDVDAGGTVQ